MVNLCAMSLCPCVPSIHFLPYFRLFTTLTTDDDDLLLPMLYALTIGLVALAVVMTFSSPEKPPKWHKIRCVVGFIVAIAWISTIADEVVGILRAFGAIVGVSEAILGVTVFAMVHFKLSLADRRAILCRTSLRMLLSQEWVIP